MSSVGLIALVGGILIMVFLVQSRGRVSGEDAQRYVAEGAKLVDVRTTEEFAGGAIAGAVNIPVQVLHQRFDELGDRDKPIVVYCRSGQRSGRAKRMLEAEGFSKVYDMGSINAWP